MDDFLNLLNQVWTSGFLGINMSQVLVTIAIFIVSLILRGIFANLGIKTLKGFIDKVTYQNETRDLFEIAVKYGA